VRGGFRHHQIHAVRSSLIRASKGASNVHSGRHGIYGLLDHRSAVSP
jgi:hypothetical protein